MGTSSWSFPGWRGLVWGNDATASQLARHGLASYAMHPLLRTVGLDRTYYAPIRALDFRRYAESVPDDFRFLVKAWEGLLLEYFPRGERWGERAGEANPHFFDAAHAAEHVVAPALEGLGAKLGPIVFQLTPERRGLFAEQLGFARRLRDFLCALPHGPLYAVELRTRTLLGKAYLEALAAAGATHCHTIHPAMPDLVAQHDVVASVADTKPLVVRWMLHAGLRYEQAAQRFAPFARLALEDPASRAAIAQRVRAAADAGLESYVVINNKAEGSAPLSVLRLAETLTGAPTALSPSGVPEIEF